MNKLTPEEKKQRILEIQNTPGEKRSYNEIKADLELQLWRERFGPQKI